MTSKHNTGDMKKKTENYVYKSKHGSILIVARPEVPKGIIYAVGSEVGPVWYDTIIKQSKRKANKVKKITFITRFKKRLFNNEKLAKLFNLC